MTLPWKVVAGNQILSFMAWRIPTRLPVPDSWFDVQFSTNGILDSPKSELLNTNGPAGDITVIDWFEIDRDVRLEDLPRMVGESRGTGIYLRALRAVEKYAKDRQDIAEKASREIVSEPERKGLFGRRRVQPEPLNREASADARQRYLDTSPPELSGLQGAIRDWIRLTEGTGSEVVRPFGGVSAPGRPSPSELHS